MGAWGTGLWEEADETDLKDRKKVLDEFKMKLMATEPHLP